MEDDDQRMPIPNSMDMKVMQVRRFVKKHRTKLLAVAVAVLYMKNQDLKKDVRGLKKQNEETKLHVDSANKDLLKAESIFDQYFGPRSFSNFYSNN